MERPGHRTEREIVSQPASWAATLQTLRERAAEAEDLFRQGGFHSVLFTGCGSTYYLALAAAATLQEVSGFPARGLPASEVWLRPALAVPAGQRALLVAFSRSGETTETLRACQTFLARDQGEVLTLTCYPESSLSRLGTLNLVFPAGREESVAQTRAFTTLYLASLALTALWAGHTELLEELAHLPAAAQHMFERYQTAIRDLGRNDGLDRFYFLGSGPRYGLAGELSLKMKEMSLSHSEPFHFLEFRHGPMSMVTSSTLIVGLVSESGRPHEETVLREMRALGARIFTVGEKDADVAFSSGLSEAAGNLLYLPVGQLLALQRSLSRGLDPDRPLHLSAVVRLAEGAA